MSFASWLRAMKSLPELSETRGARKRSRRGGGLTSRPRLEVLEDRTLPSVVSWVNGSGNWSDSTHWSTGALPTAADDAMIAPSVAISVTISSGSFEVHRLTTNSSTDLAISGGTLQLDADSTVNGTLELATVGNNPGGQITGAGNVTVGGLFTWTAGTLGGTAGSSLTATGGMSINGNPNLDFRNLINATGNTAQFTGFFNMTNGANIENQAGATFAIHSKPDGFGFIGFIPDSSIGSEFINEGLVTSDAVVLNRIQIPFINTGEVDLHTGELQLELGAVSQSSTIATTTGKYIGSANTTLNLGAGVNVTGLTFDQNSIISGDAIVFAANSFQVEGSYTANTTTQEVAVGNNSAVTFTNTAVLHEEISGLAPGTQHSQITVKGTANLTLGGTLHVDLNLTNGFTPQVGDVYTIVSDQGVNAVVGSFANLPEGQTFIAGGYQFKISYIGGVSHQDVTLTVIMVTAQQEDALIVSQVNTLVSAGTLNTGNGNALTTKLNSATASLNAGNTTAGVNQLNAFINQVTAFQRTGKLTSAQAQSLINAADSAIAAAQGTGARLINDTGAGATGAGDSQPVSDAGQLVTGTIGVYLDNANGTPVSADEQARFDDALNVLDTTFGPYGVDLVDVGVGDASGAVVQVEIANTSAAGGAADGVLGCTVAGQITLVTGWSWYTGADPRVIGAGQYDFETIVMHELGHAVGLGHSGDTGSVMYPTLASGTARRTVTAADLSVLEASSTTPEPLLAAPTLPSPSETTAIAHQEGNGAATEHSPLPAVIFDVLLGNAPLSSRTTNISPAETIAQDSAWLVQGPLASSPTLNAIGPNAASEAPRARDWFFAQFGDNDEFDRIPNSKPIPLVEVDATSSAGMGASADNVENPVPAPPQDKPAVGDEETLDRLYDEAGIDGYWTSAFNASETPLLTQPFVETAKPDASAALAVALGGFWAAAITETKRKRLMAFSPSRL